MPGLSAPQMNAAIGKMADYIIAQFDLAQIGFIGIHTAGYPLAKRLQSTISDNTKTYVPVGALDIALYRDDLGTSRQVPYMRQTEIPFDIGGKTIILVDDVLFSGRTIRAALTAVLEIGRPSKIEIAVLIDRGHRELPIMASIVGETIHTTASEHVTVRLHELNGIDEVVVN